MFLTTLRAKNGERVGPGTRPRMSHNCLSSSGSIVSIQLNYLQRRKLRSKGAAKDSHHIPGASRKPSSCRIRVGCRILRKAFASRSEERRVGKERWCRWCRGRGTREVGNGV